MRLYANYFDQFSCIGGKCKETCCCGWDILIDEKTWKKYQNIEGEFGEFVRKKIERISDKNVETGKISMDSSYCCPFLNTEGLCNIYINCGEDYLSHTCTTFPRKMWKVDNVEVNIISTSCEEVLRIIKNMREPISFCKDVSDLSPQEQDTSFFYLHEWLSFCMTKLQEEEQIFSVVLSTIVYMSLEGVEFFEKGDFLGFIRYMNNYTSIYQEFAMARNDIMKEGAEELAYEFVYKIIDSFCQILNESNVAFKERVLWPKNVFEMSDSQRREYLTRCLKERNDSLEHKRFMKRLFAAQYLYWGIYAQVKDKKTLFQDKWCTYIILAEVLPFTWGKAVLENEHELMARYSALNRVYNNAEKVIQRITDVINDLFQPDYLTYSMIFIFLYL